MRILIALLTGLGLVTTGMALLFYGVLTGWPAEPLEWARDVMFIAWGSVLAAAGFEFLTDLGDPR